MRSLRCSIICVKCGLVATSTLHTFQVQACAHGAARGHAPDHAGVAVKACIVLAVLQLHDHTLLGPGLCSRPAHHQRHLLCMASVAEVAVCSDDPAHQTAHVHSSAPGCASKHRSTVSAGMHVLARTSTRNAQAELVHADCACMHAPEAWLAAWPFRLLLGQQQ